MQHMKAIHHYLKPYISSATSCINTSSCQCLNSIESCLICHEVLPFLSWSLAFALHHNNDHAFVFPCISKTTTLLKHFPSPYSYSCISNIPCCSPFPLLFLFSFSLLLSFFLLLFCLIFLIISPAYLATDL